MLRLAGLAMLLGTLLPAQSIVPAPDFRLPARASLTCAITPIKPELTFALQLRAGYRIRIPITQYTGGGHRWHVIVRVSSQSVHTAPVYLSNEFSGDTESGTKLLAEIVGGFLVGDGTYSASLLLTDDLGRACTKEWQFRARFEARAGFLKQTLGPGTVAALSAIPPPEGPPVFERLTVLLHIASAVRGAELLQDADMQRALAQLAALLEQAPAQSVQLLVFNLDQDEVVFHADPFRWDDIARMANSVAALQLNTVDYRVLQRSTGGVLLDLVNREALASPSADAVIFLGPYRPTAAAIYPSELAIPPGRQRYFYLRYLAGNEAQAQQTGTCMVSGKGSGCSTPRVSGIAATDTISSVVAMLRGTTFDIHSPAGFAQAIRHMIDRR
jgi:hypothetical protein